MAINTNSVDLEAGSSQYLTAVDSASLSVTGNLTIEMWMNRESAGTAMSPLVKWRDSGTEKSYGVELNADSKAVMYVSANGSAYTAATVGAVNEFSTTGVWVHIAWVFTAASHNLEVFKNGVSVGSSTTITATSIFNSTETLAIGRDWSYGQYFDGLLDEVRIWSKARTGAEISADYNEELVGNEANLNAYWRLNNALTDQTANGNTLTNVNSATFSTDVPFTGASQFGSLMLLGVG